MSTIKCPECAHEISSSAFVCLSCGLRRRRILPIATLSGTFVNISVSILIVVLLVVGITRYLTGRSDTALAADQRKARQQLGMLNVAYSRESFFSTIRERDYLAVELFLL